MTAVQIAAAGVAIVADRVIGEAPAAVHPVALFGRAMAAVEPHVYRDERTAGVGYLAGGVGVALAAGIVLRRVLGRGVATLVAAEIAIAGGMLARSARATESALHEGDLGRARELLPALVGRDPSGLGEGEIARAVVESVAENTVDAVVAPALWAAALGAPGALAHRAVNTLDSMVGHRSARYERFGWASARVDDAMAWVPARVTAVAVAVVRPRAATAVWRSVRRDARQHPSPNAGVAEAAFAAALGLRLGGVNYYGGRREERPALGAGRAPVPGDIGRAVALARDVANALAAVGVALGTGAVVAGRRRGRK